MNNELVLIRKTYDPGSNTSMLVFEGRNIEVTIRKKGQVQTYPLGCKLRICVDGSNDPVRELEKGNQVEEGHPD